MSKTRKAGAVSLAVGISAACFLAGCSASIESAQHRGSAALAQSRQTLIQQAWQEREVAFAQVARAITDYCRVTSESLEGQQRCIAGRQLQLDGIRRRSTSSLEVQPDRPGDDQDTGPVHILHCHGDNRRTTCDRVQPVIAELMLYGSNWHSSQ